MLQIQFCGQPLPRPVKGTYSAPDSSLYFEDGFQIQEGERREGKEIKGKGGKVEIVPNAQYWIVAVSHFTSQWAQLLWSETRAAYTL